MEPGVPCKFVEMNSGCSIYEDRPVHPCREFECEWLVNTQIPNFLSPRFSGIVLARKKISNHWFLFATSTGECIDDIYLSWIIEYGFTTIGNVAWQLKGREIFFVGTPDFIAAAERQLRG